jgi:hypothetical protein
VAILFDGPVTPDALTTFVRNVPLPDTFGLTAMFPTITKQDNQLNFAEIVRTNRTARFRAFDGRLHVSQRDSGSQRFVKLLPLSTSFSMGEYERLQLEYARTGGTNMQALANSVYNDGQNGTREIQARLEQAWGDVLSDGKLTINEEGFQGEADYGIPVSQVVTAAISWVSSPTTSDPLADMLAWSDTYFLNNGLRLVHLVTSLTVQRALQVNTKLINAIKGAQTGVTRVSLAEINALFASEGCPTFVDYYGTQVDVDGTPTLVFPANKIAMLPANPGDVGATVMGLSATALELMNSSESDMSFEDAAGIVGVIEKTGPPYRQFTFIDAVGMPVLTTARLFMVATV